MGARLAVEARSAALTCYDLGEPQLRERRLEGRARNLAHVVDALDLAHKVGRALVAAAAAAEVGGKSNVSAAPVPCGPSPLPPEGTHRPLKTTSDMPRTYA